MGEQFPLYGSREEKESSDPKGRAKKLTDRVGRASNFLIQQPPDVAKDSRAEFNRLDEERSRELKTIRWTDLSQKDTEKMEILDRVEALVIKMEEIARK